MFSIITSLYQSDRYLPKFSANLKKFAVYLQNHNIPFELIVIANNPTNAERKFAENFAKESWFKFFSVSREPLYASWNRGVELASGEFISPWNVDDERYPEALVEANLLFSAGADLVYFPFKILRYIKFFGWYFLVFIKTVRKQVLEYNPQTQKQFLYEMHCGPFFIFTKALYNKVGPFDEQFKIAGDFDWCIRAAKIGGRLVKAKSLAGEFRVDGGGLSAGKNETLVAENNTLFRRHGFTNLIKAENLEISKNYQSGTIKFRDRLIKI